MSRPRSFLAGACAVAALLVAAAAPAVAQQYPEKPIRLVIPFEPAGFTDHSARMTQRVIEQLKLLPQPIVPVNVVGGGGVVGARQVKEAAPDGYTMLIMSIALLGGKARGVVDFGTEAYEPVAIAGESCYVVVVRKDAPWNNLREFLEDAKKRPNEITYGVPIGAAGHMTVLLMEQQVPGAKFRVVNSGGSGTSLPALLGGHIMAHTATAESFVKFPPETKGLALMGPSRIPATPDLKTAKEQGIDVEMCLQNGFYMPKGTPRRAVDTMADALEKMIASQEYKDSFKDGAYTFTFKRGKTFEDQLAADAKKVEGIAAGLRGGN